MKNKLESENLVKITKNNLVINDIIDRKMLLNESNNFSDKDILISANENDSRPLMKVRHSVLKKELRWLKKIQNTIKQY